MGKCSQCAGRRAESPDALLLLANDRFREKPSFHLEQTVTVPVSVMPEDERMAYE